MTVEVGKFSINLERTIEVGELLSKLEIRLCKFLRGDFLLTPIRKLWTKNQQTGNIVERHFWKNYPIRKISIILMTFFEKTEFWEMSKRHFWKQNPGHFFGH